MKITYLKTFIKVAELKNFRQAAKELQYSQPTITLQIKNLEKELGTPLFDRTVKGAVLTEQGEKLVPYAKRIVHGWEEAVEAITVPSGIFGHVNIGCPDSIVLFILHDIVEDFCRTFDSVSVKIQTGEFPRLIEALDQSRLDFIYLLNKRLHYSHWKKLFEKEEKIVFVCRPDLPGTDKSALTLADLAARKLVLADMGSTTSYSYELRKLFEEQGISPRCVLEISNPGNLAVLPVQGVDISMWQQIFCLEEKWLSPAVQEFISRIEQVI